MYRKKKGRTYLVCLPFRLPVAYAASLTSALSSKLIDLPFNLAHCCHQASYYLHLLSKPCQPRKGPVSLIHSVTSLFIKDIVLSYP